MTDVDSLARALLPAAIPQTVAEVYSTVADPVARRWASQHGVDFLGAWNACPDPDWLIIFALVASSHCSAETKERVAGAITSALDPAGASQAPPSALEQDAFARAVAGDASGVGFFRRATGGSARTSRDLVDQLRASLDGASILREAGLVP